MKYVPDLDILADVTFNHTESIIDRSLRRLNRDALDLVQFHWWDYNVPGYVEVALDLLKLKEKGKIRNIGVTNFDAPHLKEIVDAGVPIVSCQSQYSLFDRRPELALSKYCEGANIKHVCYGTLAGGLLAKRWEGVGAIKPETRSQVKYLQVLEDSVGYEGYQKLLELLEKIASHYGVSVSHIATKHILGRPSVACTIVGVRNSHHVADNCKIFRIRAFARGRGGHHGVPQRIPAPSGRLLHARARKPAIQEHHPHERERGGTGRKRRLGQRVEATPTISPTCTAGISSTFFTNSMTVSFCSGSSEPL